MRATVDLLVVLLYPITAYKPRTISYYFDYNSHIADSISGLQVLAGTWSCLLVTISSQSLLKRMG